MIFAIIAIIVLVLAGCYGSDLEKTGDRTYQLDLEVGDGRKGSLEFVKDSGGVIVETPIRPGEYAILIEVTKDGKRISFQINKCNGDGMNGNPLLKGRVPFHLQFRSEGRYIPEEPVGRYCDDLGIRFARAVRPGGRQMGGVAVRLRLMP